MTRWLVSFILQGIILPVSLFVAIAMRQSATSGLYLLLLFASPLVPVPTSKSMSGASGIYQKIVIVTSTLNMLGMMAFQIVLACYQPYGSIVQPFCSEPERLLRYAGFVRLDELPWLSVFFWVFPDLAVSLTALFVHTVCAKLNPPATDEQLLPIAEQAPADPEPSEGDTVKKRRKLSVLVSLGKYVTIMSLFFAGAIRPSGLNSVYFLTFLFFMTWWAFNKNLGKPFAYILRIISGFVAGHIVVIFVYQLMWMQDKVPDRQPLARYLGLRALYNSTCVDPRVVDVTDYEADTFVNPLLLIWLYFILSHESSLIINVPVVDLKDAGMTRQLSTRLSQRGRLLRNQTNRWRSATRKVRLIRGRESIYRRTPVRRGLVQDAMGSVTITEVEEESPKEPGSPITADGSGRPQGDVESIELDDLTDKENGSIEKDAGGIVDIALNACIAIFQFIAQTSYIATNIIMMTWSITYHSWITFVLLLWASAMWLVPNQRKAMLRSSPFLVFYAIFLLVAQYVYGMDLTEAELPEDIQGYNLQQIGFKKAKHFPLKPLLFKTLFTMMFWITLKQHNQEKWEARNRSALEDIAAPLQIGVGTAAGVSGDPNAATSNLIRKIGQFTRSVLTKFWIWVVACILFTIGIVGERMTIFKIIYMAMALLFILTFQLSWTLWRKIMYGFWLVVIIFSMFILVCTYTYQFDHFSEYWEKYLHLNVQLQEDMGLEKYETTELFVKLLTPTFFVVITVIQLYYFHDDFLAISDIKSRNTSISGAPGRGRNSDSVAPSSVSQSSRSNLYAQLWAAVDFVWLFLEVHLMKLVIFSLALLAIYNVCAAHSGFLLLSVIAALFGSNIQTLIAHICSCLISLLIILKMIYQINYIDHNDWNVSCKESNETYNTAVWFGFEKVDKDHSLPSLLQGYIGVLIVITLHAVVVRRQKFHRVQKGRPPNRPTVMFPRVTYKDIDRDTLFFMKYMLNYGFYRFGVEVSLIGIVGLIGLRMDFYATLYALWLFLIISPIRPKLSKIWPLLTVFIVITIPIQYVLAVGLPPNLCIEMPWNKSETWIRLRDWMFLPDNKSPPPVHRLLYDFVVLMFVARQGFMFRLEKRNRNVEFPGGDNSSVVRQIERVGVNNPVPDFISTTRSFLDVIKRVVLTSFYWISLAVFFLAGTNRVNIFSLGYLIGAFVFLWHGNDFYLRPIKSILKWWHYLIIYNVHVIVIKTLLQILGCIFIDYLKAKFCWAVQLLGIACVYKVHMADRIPIPSPEHECTVPKDDVGLTWDFFCFTFLILQRRLFSSFYFYRIINEAKAMAILASRGAELIEELSDRQVQAQMESENRLLEKIKNKMDRIKASQKKIQQKEGREYKEPGDHFSETLETAPLAHDSTPSISSPTSPQGFHTPVEDEFPNPLSRGGSFLHPPTPTSAILSRSLDGYLDPQRFSFGSPPPPSPLQRGPSLDDSFPVFSPPPYGSIVHNRPRRGSSFIGPPWLPPHTTPRQSIISNASPKSHHTSIRSGDYYMFEDYEDDLDLISEKSGDSGLTGFSDEQVDVRRTSVSQLISTAMKSDMKQATSQAKANYEESKAIARKPLLEDDDGEMSKSVPPPSPKDKHGKVIDSAKASVQESPSTTPPLPPPDGSMTPPLPPPDGSKVVPHSQPSSDSTPLSAKDRVVVFLKFVYEFVNSIMVSVTRRLNKTSRDYRYVMKALTAEKKKLLSSPNFGVGTRPGRSRVWRPHPKMLSSRRDESEVPIDIEATPSTSDGRRAVTDDIIRADDDFRDDDNVDMTPQSPAVSFGQFEEGELRASEQPPIIRLIIAIWFAVLSHSDLVCYFVIFLHQIYNPTMLSLPLPLMVFLWGTLTVPRPSKRFWVTIIAYTEVVVVIKCMFQLEMLPWNKKVIPENNPFFPPRIIGVERKPGTYAYFDLILLLVVFFHRAMLKSLGLWKMIPSEGSRRTSVSGSSRKPIAGGAMMIDSDVKDHDSLDPHKKTGLDQSGHGPTFLDLEHSKLKDMLKALGLGKMIPSEGSRRTSVSGSSRKPIDGGAMMLDSDVKDHDSLDPHKKTGLDQSGHGPTFLDLEHSKRKDMLKALGLGKMIPSEGSRRTSVSGSSRKPIDGGAMMLDSDVKDHDSLDPHKKTGLDQSGHGPTFLDLEHSKRNKYPCFHPMLKFFTKLLRSKGRVTTDVYAFMFFCDFSNFMVVIFGFAAFGSNQGDGGVSQYFEENKVPVAFLIMLILQFVLIIVDRTLYLRKYIFGKLIFQYVLVVGIHVWMFFILPAVTQRQFNAASPPQLWYTIKCFYLLLSAYQIRCGYPSRIYGNFLCKGYNYINYYLFKVFMAVPFVFELRALMDWIWTDTSMTLSDWLKMEDIFAHVYQLKCQRRAEREYPQERGVKKASSTKYIVGGGCLVGIICVIWFPLVLFALGNTVGKANLPTDVTVSVRIGAFAPIYQYTAQNDSILRLTPAQWDSVNAIYSNSRSATTFLSNYLFDDVGVVALSRHSTAVWTISPPDNTTFISDLLKDKAIPIRLDWTINRQTSSPEHPPTISDSQADFIEAGDPNRKILIEYLENNVTNSSSRVGFPALFPKFLKITNRGSATPVQTLMHFNDDEPEDGGIYRGILGALHQTDKSMWWDLTENCSFDVANMDWLRKFPYMKSCDEKLIMYTFSDKAFPSSLSIISGKGIIGLYTTFVIVIHSIIRGFFTGISATIMFDDMPNVDRLLQLCLDIYLVRESRELDLEEDLFAKLVFLYRSPETLIKWTRPPEEIGEDEADEQPELD